jgi:branched-subunit amino acid aminotransferase/4-amino-4-deoxychorismate lyase
MRVLGKSAKILFYKAHIDNLVKSLNKYNIRKKNLRENITKLIKLNLKKNKNYDHLLRVASNNKIISISLRKRPIPKYNFKLKLVNYKRVDAVYKNLKYKKILKILSKLNVTKFDIALYKNKKILETGTSNLLFVKNNKIFSPNKDCYKGTTIKFFSKKVKINYTNIFLRDLIKYEEILIVGSGKGVVSISSIEGNSWKRKSLKLFNKLVKIYKSEIKNN